MTQITLYGTPMSTYVRTVRMLLEEAGVAYTLQDVNIFAGENQSADYLAKQPFGKVPAIEVDGASLYETSAITDYLNTIVAQGRFSPADPLLQARMRQLIAIIDNYLYPSAISAIVIQRLIVAGQGGQVDEAIVQNAVAPAQKAAQALEAIAHGTPYLLGDKLTIADFYLIPVFIYLAQTPEFAAVTADTPKLNAWWNTVSQLPVVQKVCA